MNILLTAAGFILLCTAVSLGMKDEFLASAIALILGMFALIYGGSRLLGRRQ